MARFLRMFLVAGILASGVVVMGAAPAGAVDAGDDATFRLAFSTESGNRPRRRIRWRSVGSQPLTVRGAQMIGRARRLGARITRLGGVASLAEG